MTDVNSVAESKIWKRVDGQFTAFKVQVSGASYLDQFPGATEMEKRLSEARQPGGTWIYNGNVSDEPGAGFPIERYHGPSTRTDAIVVQSATKPSFGEWAELDEWPTWTD